MPIPQTITLNGGAAPDENSNLLLNDNITGDNPENDDRGAGVPRSPTIKPMDHLVSSRRRNICWSVSLLIFFLGLIGSLAVWRFQHQDETVSTAMGRAQHALYVLNRHYKTQSHTIGAGCEATIMILRHCEKHGPFVFDEDGNEHCSYLGMERAQYLATLFGPQNDTTANTTPRWPTPSYLFALTPDRGSHWNYREYETLRPLAKRLGQEVDVIDPIDLPPRLFDLLQSGEMCGRLAVVSWKHEYIPDLATALACGPEQGCPSVFPVSSFDQVWQLKYVFRPKLDYAGEQDALNNNDNTEDSHRRKKKKRPTKDNSDNGTQEQDDNGIGDDDDDDGDDDDDDDEGEGEAGDRRLLTRGLRKHRKNDGWFVYATIQRQDFDPLSFSGHVGDYAPEGVPYGGRWKDDEI